MDPMPTFGTFNTPLLPLHLPDIPFCMAYAVERLTRTILDEKTSYPVLFPPTYLAGL